MNKSIGIIGAGQLGKMLIEAGIKWNISFNILESDSTPSICGNFANRCIRGSLHNKNKIVEISNISDVITFEIEDINVEGLEELEKNGKKVIPSSKILRLIKDKGIQKSFYKQNNIPTANFVPLENIDNLDSIPFDNKDKLVIKNCKGGYDGKGVNIINYEDFNDFLNNKNNERYIVEEYIDCQKELSVIVCRDQKGNSICYPIVEMVFNEHNILQYQICPVKIDKEIEENIYTIAIDTIKKLDGVGIFAIEIFLDKNRNVYVNEISPRPHNSGHHTIEACQTSQYEQLLRILLDLPLGSTEIIKPSIMMNLLGPENHVGDYQLSNKESLSNNLYIHLYGKQPSKPLRKLGHVTILGNTLDELLNTYKWVNNNLSIIPKDSIIPDLK